MPNVHRIGILTGGGDAPGLNGVIRAIVKGALNEYGLEVIGFLDGFYGLVMNHYRQLDRDSVSGILHRGGTILGTSNRDNPFHFALKENNQLVFKDMSDEAIKNLHKLNVDVLIVIGGDGSLSIGHELSKKGLKVVGVPKTIDNDLSATDVTFGFDTAVATATEALDRLHTTAESHHRIMVLEVMGRYAGWIALYSGIAGGADVILIPEIPYELAAIKKKVLERRSAGKLFSIIVVAEGAVEKDGEMVVAQIIKESPDPIRLGGAGQVVASRLVEVTGLETRTTVLGHLQRGGVPSSFDRILSTRCGIKAVQMAVQGPWNHMVALNGQEITAVELGDAIKQLKKVDPLGEIVKAAQSVGISFGV